MKEISPEEITQMESSEKLLRLRAALRSDRESIDEILGEIIEQREQEAAACGFSMWEIQEQKNALLSLYAELEKAIHIAPVVAMKKRKN